MSKLGNEGQNSHFGNRTCLLQMLKEQKRGKGGGLTVREQNFRYFDRNIGEISKIGGDR